MRFALVCLAVLAAAGLALLFLSSGPEGDSLVAPMADDSNGSGEAGDPGKPPPGTGERERASWKGPLRGLVLDAADVPVPGADVLARVQAEDGWPGPVAAAPVVAAGELGEFAFPALAPGRYALEARHERGWGYLPGVLVTEDGAREAVVRLLPEAEIEGRVVNESGQPVEGAVVTTDLSGFLRYFHGRTGRPGPQDAKSFSAPTDEQGAFHLECLPVGRFDLRVTGAGYASRTIPGVVAPGEGLVLRLSEGHTLPFRVTFSGPMPEKVRIDADPSDAGITINTDPDRAVAEGGGVRIEIGDRFVKGELAGLPEGLTRVTVRAKGYAARSQEVVIRPGIAPKTLGFELDEGNPVRGVAWLAGGTTPLSGVQLEFVDASSPKTAEAAATCESGERGIVEVLLAPGLYGVFSVAGGRRRPVGFVEVGGRRFRGPQFAVMVPRFVTGTVRLPDGVPAVGARVEAIPVRGNAPTPESVVTGPSGQYVIEGLDKDTAYSVRAVGADGQASETKDLGAGAAPVNLDLVLASAGRGGVRGRLVNEREEPVARAQVVMPGATAVADADGRFTIEDVPSGRRNGWILAAGHPPVSLVIDFPADDFVDLGEILVPWRDPVIWGKVVHPDGSPFDGARVRLVDSVSGDAVAETTSRADGVFGLAWPLSRDARARLLVTAPGRGPREATGDMAALSRTDDFVLIRPATVRGDLRQRVSGSVHLVLVPETGGDEVRIPVECAARGRFVARYVPLGTWRMSLEGAYIKDRDAGVVTVEAGADLDLGRLDRRRRDR